MPDLPDSADKTEDSQFLRTFLARRQQLEALVKRRVGCGATAADLVQELFLRFWKRPTQVESLDQYLMRSAHNLAIDHLRGEQARQRSLQQMAPQDEQTTPSLDDLLQAKDALQLVEQALRHLPERTRHVFLLNRVHGCTYADIARSMNLSQSAVEKHMMRALTTCKSALEQQYPAFASSGNEPS